MTGKRAQRIAKSREKLVPDVENLTKRLTGILPGSKKQADQAAAAVGIANLLARGGFILSADDKAELARAKATREAHRKALDEVRILRAWVTWCAREADVEVREKSGRMRHLGLNAAELLRQIDAGKLNPWD